VLLGKLQKVPIGRTDLYQPSPAAVVQHVLQPAAKMPLQNRLVLAVVVVLAAMEVRVVVEGPPVDSLGLGGGDESAVAALLNRPPIDEAERIKLIAVADQAGFFLGRHQPTHGITAPHPVVSGLPSLGPLAAVVHFARSFLLIHFVPSLLVSGVHSAGLP
jgi:hypothetical protein